MDDLDWVDDESSSFEADETLWKRLESHRYTDGFKDGTVEGGERALQMGFNLGYKQTIKQLYQVAKIKGVITNVIELMQADGTSHQTQNETDALKQELEEDWVAYVTHLKNVNTPSTNSSHLPAKPGASCADKTELKSSSIEEDIPCTTDGSCCKSKPEMPLSTDSTLIGASSDITPSEINFSSRTLAVDNSDVTAFSRDDKFSKKTADNAICSNLNAAEDSQASTVMAAEDKVSDSTLIEYKVPATTSTESASVEGQSDEGIHDPCDIMSVLTCDLYLHADELDIMGKSLFEKYLPKLEKLLRKWKTE